MHVLRAEVFNGRNQWNLTIGDGLEKDSFDSNETVYVICVQLSTNDVVACWRILPTTFDYMLSTVFSDLLPAPLKIKDPYIWELSRFAVKKGLNKCSPMLASTITRDMFAAIREFALQKEVTRFVTVVSPSLYRLLSNSGLTMPHIDNKNEKERRRLGRTACYIDIDDGFHEFIDTGMRSAVLQNSI
ncbi:acyl-homoserine-lactone synthase [Halomonas caseinilytica]